jgi:hypothetical protein
VKKYLFITILLIILISSNAFATAVVRGGIRGSSIAFGIEDHHELSWTEWVMDYGAELTTGAPIILGYLSFNKIIGKASDSVPVYLSFGPAIGIGNGGAVGGFAHLGFDGIFDTPRLFCELGVDAMTPHGTGASLELGYRF